MKKALRWMLQMLEYVISPLFALYFRYLEVHVFRAIGRACLYPVKAAPGSVRFHGRVWVSVPEKLLLGEYVRIGRGSFLNCEGGIAVGRNTQISRNVVVYSSGHNYEVAAIPYDDTYVLRPVEIGEHVWIGMNVCILPGVKIGDGAIIGMGSVISKDVPAGAIVVGSTQRFIRYRDLDTFHALDLSGEWFAKKWPDA
jgi:acetyltransferase-like isoleucine patch superfamily enzyme